MNISDILARDGIHCGDTVRVFIEPREYYLAELWIPDAASIADPPEEWDGETPEAPMGEHPEQEMGTCPLPRFGAGAGREMDKGRLGRLACG